MDSKLKRFERWSFVREKTKEKRPRENARKLEFTISNGCMYTNLANTDSIV